MNSRKETIISFHIPLNSRENRIKIFVDGNCIVCDREISHYKKIAPDLFDLIDISNPQFNAAAFQLDPVAVDRYLHVLLPNENSLSELIRFSPSGKHLNLVTAFLDSYEESPPFR